MRKFTTGAVRDSDDKKEDYIETISWTAFRRYAQYMTSKKSRYGQGNFKKGIPYRVLRAISGKTSSEVSSQQI